MKSIIIMILMTFFINLSCAQESITPPDEVLKAFLKIYPEAEDIEWEKEGAYFEAEFIKDGYEISVVLDEQGNIMGTKKERVDAAEIDETDKAQADTADKDIGDDNDDKDDNQNK